MRLSMLLIGMLVLVTACGGSGHKSAAAAQHGPTAPPPRSWVTTVPTQHAVGEGVLLGAVTVTPSTVRWLGHDSRSAGKPTDWPLGVGLHLDNSADGRFDLNGGDFSVQLFDKNGRPLTPTINFGEQDLNGFIPPHAGRDGDAVFLADPTVGPYTLRIRVGDLLTGQTAEWAVSAPQ